MGMSIGFILCKSDVKLYQPSTIIVDITENSSYLSWCWFWRYFFQSVLNISLTSWNVICRYTVNQYGKSNRVLFISCVEPIYALLSVVHPVCFWSWVGFNSPFTPSPGHASLVTWPHVQSSVTRHPGELQIDWLSRNSTSAECITTLSMSGSQPSSPPIVQLPLWRALDHWRQVTQTTQAEMLKRKPPTNHTECLTPLMPTWAISWFSPSFWHCWHVEILLHLKHTIVRCMFHICHKCTQPCYCGPCSHQCENYI